MAIARARKSSPAAGEPSTVVGDGSSAGRRGAAPFSKLVEEPGLSFDQMRLAIDEGVLMVLGPDGDPVPPQAFWETAAAHLDVLLSLPDGTKAPASRVAAVLRAQVLGRLGRPAAGSEWILTMLRAPGMPELASDDQLGAGRGPARPAPKEGS